MNFFEFSVEMLNLRYNGAYGLVWFQGKVNNGTRATSAFEKSFPSKRRIVIGERYHGKRIDRLVSSLVSTLYTSLHSILSTLSSLYTALYSLLSTLYNLYTLHGSSLSVLQTLHTLYSLPSTWL